MNSESSGPKKTNPTRPYFAYRASWPEDEPIIRSIRHQVFVLEQKVPTNLEWDGTDAVCRHVLVKDSQERPIATGRLDPHGKIGRMAVLPDARHFGAGSLVLTALLEWARELSFENCYLHAQTHALPFYYRHGFEEEGLIFYEANIPHQKMIRPTKTPITQRVAGPNQMARALRRLMAMTRRHLRIDSPQQLPAQAAWTDLLETTLRLSKNRSPIADAVRILVLPDALKKTEMTIWVELARRLPSHVAIRCPAPDQPSPAGALVMGDGKHLLRISGGDETQAFLRLEDPQETLPETKRFDDRWERASPLTETSLGLS